VSEQPDGYSLGLAAGRIAERLDGHDKHFTDINGSIGRLADEMHGMALAVQRLGQAADADRATVITTATALEKAAQARRDNSESRWSPTMRLTVIIAALAAVAGAVAAIVYGLRG
jgi:hypothetical protein